MKRRIVTAALAALIIAAFSLPLHAAGHMRLTRGDWDSNVKRAVNDFLDMYGKDSPDYDPKSYVVFDFDNTCSIFDVGQQAFTYQLLNMTFGFTPDELPSVLSTGLGDLDEDRTLNPNYGHGSYRDRIEDIQAAYRHLYKIYGPFTKYHPFTDKFIGEATKKEMHKDPMWLEFATKMVALYGVIGQSESVSVVYPWVGYWFTGMTEDQVYNLSRVSHNMHKDVHTVRGSWISPEEIKSKAGVCKYTWTRGVAVSLNIIELMQALKDNGIDVWVCSASDSEVVRAAIDEWGLHDCVTGLLAMTDAHNAEGVRVSGYDYETGMAWLTKAGGGWVKDTFPTKAQTQGKGKVIAIDNAVWHKYGKGPIAGFMDSTGDFNFCTEYDTLKLVLCINRASLRPTDGGGLISELAVYQRDTLGYDLRRANAAGDTLYVLQGRNENGLRSLRRSDKTLVYGSAEEKLFAGEENEKQLQYMIDNRMTTREIIDTFAVKTNADAPGNPLGFKYGFLDKFDGYHTHK